MDSPSWMDVFSSSFSSCLQCFKATSSDSDSDVQRPPRYLESLLTEPLLDTDTEAETVSLHSNVGDNQRRRKQSQKQKQKKQITFFGFDLFGKRTTGPIHLPEDEEEADELLRRSRRQRRRPTGTSSSSSPSTITFDGNVSDAAPLDSAAIDERVMEEEEIRAAKEREKEERRRKRKEKKEMKKLAQVLMQNRGEGEFEGFQGSGGSYPHIPSPFQQGFLPSPPSDDFGPFHQGHAHAAYGDEDETADLDGGLYAARNSNEGGSSVSGGGSDSRRSPRGTSTSRSDYSNPRPLAADVQPKAKKSKKSTSTSSSKTKSSKSRSSASATSSQPSDSLVSPASPISSMSPTSPLSGIPPSIAEDKPTLEFEGSGFPRPGFGTFDDSQRSFPSPGLGFNGAPRNGVARGGAFLASRD